MQFKDTLRALVLSALSCLIVFSCITVDKSIGIDNVPNEYQLVIKSESFPLPVGMKMLENIQGASDSYIIVGSFRTEEFGEATFSSAGNIAPNSTALDLGKDPKIISTQLRIPLATESNVPTSVILDPSQEGIPQTFTVYRLKTLIDSTTLFNNSLSEDDYDHTPLNTNTLTYFGGDSIRVYLDNSFGAELLTATEQELDSIQLFSNRFKGIYIKCDPPVPGSYGGRLNLFDLNYAFIYLKYNFQPTWAENLPRKDTTIEIVLGYDYQLNTSTFSSKKLETPEAAESLYLEGIGGVAPYVDAQKLKGMLDNWAAQKGYDPSKVVISKASLVFPFEFPENINMLDYAYPEYLFPTHRTFVNDTTNIKYYYLFNDYNSTNNSLGIINRSLKHYECEISSTIQEIMNKSKDEIDDTYNMWIYPLAFETSSDYYGYSTPIYYINNYNYFKAKLNGPSAERHPELRLVYTVIN